MAMSAETELFDYTPEVEADVGLRRKRLVVEETLQKMLERDGKVEATKLLAEARDPEHPLHDHFEWNDSIAGEHWRLQQAYQMIMACKFLVEQRELEAAPQATENSASRLREYVSPIRGEGFVGRKTMLSSDELRARFAKNCRAELRSWCAKVIDIPELRVLRAKILEELG